MYKKLHRKLAKNEGSISLSFVLMIPVILMILFLMIDYLKISSDKVSLQRRVDAAVLGIVAEAMPKDDVTVDIDGIITSGENTGQKVCQITTEMVDRAIDRLKEDAYDVGIDLTGIVNLANEDQMRSGIARIQAKGYSENLMLNSMINGGIKVPFVVEGYAVCSVKVVE